MSSPKYRRILLKLSGEALMGNDAFGINRETVMNIVAQIKEVVAAGVQVAVVVGGGNIFRGMAGAANGMERVAETYTRPKAIQYLEEGKVVIFAAGTGNPFFTTDTAAALRGAEMNCDIMLKATNVDGVYTADPKKDASAVRYQSLSFDEAISKQLKVMDATAFALCREQKLNIQVFGIFKDGALKRVVMGEDEGSLVSC